MGVLNRNITKPEGRLLYTDGRPYSFLADYIYAQLHYNQKSVAGSVIQATRTVEFEDGLRTEVLIKASTAILLPALTPIPTQVIAEGGVVFIQTPVRPNSNLLGSAHRWY